MAKETDLREKGRYSDRNLAEKSIPTPKQALEDTKTNPDFVKKPGYWNFPAQKENVKITTRPYLLCLFNRYPRVINIRNKKVGEIGHSVFSLTITK